MVTLSYLAKHVGGVLKQLNKQDLVKRVSNRTHLSESLVDKFSRQDLNSYYNRLSHPALHNISNNASRGFMIGAVIGYFNGLFQLAPTIAFIAVAGGLKAWHITLNKGKRQVQEDMTKRIAIHSQNIPSLTYKQ